VDDPLELERLAAQEHVKAESRFIVTGDPDEVVDRVAPYVEMGFRHLVFHSPAPDQGPFLERFGAEVLPRMREKWGLTPNGGR
jgi:coenzyme F420-dependent glucose-6-phosphate dehydrogenase